MLFVENSTGIGGSTISLFRLVSQLREGPYRPLVLFYEENGYVSQFKELGIDVFLLRSQPQAANRLSLPSVRNRIGGIARLARPWRQLLLKDVPEALRLRDLIKTSGVGLVHINGRFGSSRGAILASRLARVPCLCHVRDFHSFDHLDRWFATGVEHFLYISRAVQDHTERLLPRARGRIVYDGVDLVPFQERTDLAPESQNRDLPMDYPVIGTMGRLVEWKGHHVFLEALSQIAGDFPRLRAVVAGEPDPPAERSYLDRLHALTRDLGLAHMVKFVGFVMDVPRFMAGLDVFVHSSIRPEPFGLTILEGMAAGRPVVATAAGGVLDLLREGETGKLVPLGDPRSMAEALRLVVSDRRVAFRIGDAARNEVAQRFTIEKFAQSVERAYSAVLT